MKVNTLQSEIKSEKSFAQLTSIASMCGCVCGCARWCLILSQKWIFGQITKEKQKILYAVIYS